MENKKYTTEWVAIKRLITVDGVDLDVYNGKYGVIMAKDLNGRYAIAHECSSYPSTMETKDNLNNYDVLKDEILPDKEIMHAVAVYWNFSYEQAREQLIVFIETTFPFANNEDNLKIAKNELPEKEPEEPLKFSLEDWEKRCNEQ